MWTTKLEVLVPGRLSTGGWVEVGRGGVRGLGRGTTDVDGDPTVFRGSTVVQGLFGQWKGMGLGSR